MSPDWDGDGLPNDLESKGWCNSIGCFKTDPWSADTDGDSLTDGEEKLFEANPGDAKSPGIYVIYQGHFQTRRYYPWQPYGHKLIARGDDFDPPRPDVIDARSNRVDLDAVVVRRGTTFFVGGPRSATLEISKSRSSLTSLSKFRDPYTGMWQVTVPAGGTVGKYQLALGDERMDLLVIFELTGPSSELSQAGIDRFLYHDDVNATQDNVSVLMGDRQTDFPYGFVAEGVGYAFDNQQYNRFMLEDYVINAINGATNPRSAAYALTDRADALTVFRNPRVLASSWSVLHPGSNLRQQCSAIAGLLSAFARSAGIPARPVIIDWRNSSFDHSTEVWLSGTWRVFRGYRAYEMNPLPDNTQTGCSAGAWPRCGSYKDYSRSEWGRILYKPWHSGGGGIGNVLVQADENWQYLGGTAFRWPSWDVDTIKLDPNRMTTRFSIYWRNYGWTREPTNTGYPGWPPPPGASGSSELGAAAAGIEAIDFQSPQVQLGEVVAERGIDDNGNGQYDRLVLEVEVNAAQPGTYWLLGQLSASQPDPALMATAGLIAESVGPVNLNTGSQVVQLIFDGHDISQKHVAGPYLLSGLWITDVENPGMTEFVNDSLAYRSNLYTTAAYAGSDFETYGALLSGNYSHSAVDADGNGRPEALAVNTSIDVYQPGTYSVEASLYDTQGRYISYARWTGSGPEVTLQFESVDGTVGPYMVRELTLLDAEGQNIDYIMDAYTVEPIPALARPSVASLQILPADAGQLMAAGEAITPTHSFAESLVGGNLQFQAGVEVGEAGSYRLEAWLADTAGDLITVAMGEPTQLAIGTHQLSLTFPGHLIRDHGVPGPYTIAAVKILRGAGGYEVLDKVDVAMTTRAYGLNQFAAGPHTIFQDSMEEGGGHWSADAAWRIIQEAPAVSSHAWYGTEANASLNLASPLNLSNKAPVYLKFRTAYHFGNGGDAGYVEVSLDGTNWKSVATFSGDAAWSTQAVELRGAANQQRVYLRFRLAAQGGTANDAWLIDDILIAGKPDADNDGLGDEEERGMGTNPNDTDTDDDGMPDGWEVDNGLDPRRNDGGGDKDRDGLTNVEEYRNRTNPNNPDSDGDGLSDGDEVHVHHTNPNKRDTDGDGLSDRDEVAAGTDPLSADGDRDGLSDKDEVNLHHSDPNNPDTDGDGLSDGDEVNRYGTDPTKADTDGDGIRDDWEIGHGLNPLNPADGRADPDGDGLTNLEEYELGTNPTDPDSDDDGVIDSQDPHPLPRILLPIIVK
jgi:hypothetical protein